MSVLKWIIIVCFICNHVCIVIFTMEFDNALLDVNYDSDLQDVFFWLSIKSRVVRVLFFYALHINKNYFFSYLLNNGYLVDIYPCVAIFSRKKRKTLLRATGRLGVRVSCGGGAVMEMDGGYSLLSKQDGLGKAVRVAANKRVGVLEDHGWYKVYPVGKLGSRVKLVTKRYDPQQRVKGKRFYLLYRLQVKQYGTLSMLDKCFLDFFVKSKKLVGNGGGVGGGRGINTLRVFRDPVVVRGYIEYHVFIKYTGNGIDSRSKKTNLFNIKYYRCHGKIMLLDVPIKARFSVISNEIRWKQVILAYTRLRFLDNSRTLISIYDTYNKR